MILRCVVVILRCFLVAIAALFLLAVAVLISALSYTQTYDRSDLNYSHYLSVFDQVSGELAGGGRLAKDYHIDLAPLNNGEWKTACIFGGYNRPVDYMEARGALIEETDRMRMKEAGSGGFRLYPIEEREFAIAYVDLQNTVRFIHFERGIGPEGQHLVRCISKPQTRITLALYGPAVDRPAMLLFPKPTSGGATAP